MKTWHCLSLAGALVLAALPLAAQAGTRAWSVPVTILPAGALPSAAFPAAFPAAGAAGISGTAHVLPGRKSIKVDNTFNLIGGGLYAALYSAPWSGLLGMGPMKSTGAN